MTLYSVGQITLIVHSAPLYESFGVSAATAALLISLTAGVAIVPRLLAGRSRRAFSASSSGRWRWP